MQCALAAETINFIKDAAMVWLGAELAVAVLAVPIRAGSLLSGSSTAAMDTTMARTGLSSEQMQDAINAYGKGQLEKLIRTTRPAVGLHEPFIDAEPPWPTEYSPPSMLGGPSEPGGDTIDLGAGTNKFIGPDPTTIECRPDAPN